jgi:galactokinase
MKDMNNKNQLINKIEQGCFDTHFASLYGEDTLAYQKERYSKVVDSHYNTFGRHQKIYLFSSPGRVEIVGNHTDHNNGCVLCGAINLDIIGAVSKNEDEMVRIYSEEFGSFTVDLTDFEIHEEERNTPEALVRGTAASCKDRGWGIGGFDACFSSDLMVGSGLSSSAAFEVMIATIFSYLYNETPIPLDEVASIGMMAETRYFGKPSGLMDQMAAAVGGITFIDFQDSWRPKFEALDFNLSSMGLAIVVVDTGESHEDLVSNYASIPFEMSCVAGFFGQEHLRGVQEAQIMEKLRILREECGDRAVLRALHYLDENKRVILATEAIKKGDGEGLLNIINESGSSSFQYLQNIYDDNTRPIS